MLGFVKGIRCPAFPLPSPYLVLWVVMAEQLESGSILPLPYYLPIVGSRDKVGHLYYYPTITKCMTDH